MGTQARESQPNQRRINQRMSATMKPAQKVGGVRHKGKKNTQQPKPKPVNQPPIDPLLNTSTVPEVKAPSKSPQKQTQQKMKEPKQHSNSKQNNPKINQPKQGY